LKPTSTRPPTSCRGNADHSEFRGYVFALLFYRRISDCYEEEVRTQVDALAIACGTSHGAYKFTRPPTGDILAIGYNELDVFALPDLRDEHFNGATTRFADDVAYK
jgi:hypothetical protein